jgi:nucleoside-diphosphate-sugar epimerase
MRVNQQTLEGKNVVVTGASGYIGSKLVEKLLLEKCQITRVSRSKLTKIDGVADLQANTFDRSTWKALLNDAEIIFHLAGNTSVKTAAQDPEQSYLSTVNPIILLNQENSEKRKPARIVYASTATVYGITSSLPVSESFRINPLTIYDEHKALAEIELRGNGNYSADNVILRLANVYGYGLNKSSSADRGVLNQVALKAIEGNDIELYGGGEFLRDYVHLEDVVNAFIMAAGASIDKCETLNVGSGSSLTLKEAFQTIVKKVNSRIGTKSKIKNVAFPNPSNLVDQRNFQSDIGRIKEVLNWTPKVTFEAGVNQMLDGLLNDYSPK